MYECILRDKNGKGIDWFDPIVNKDDVVESDDKLTINHANGDVYVIDRKNYSSYTVRKLRSNHERKILG